MPADTASSADTIGIDPSALFQGRNIYLGVSDGLFTASIFAGAEPAKSFTVQIFFVQIHIEMFLFVKSLSDSFGNLSGNPVIMCREGCRKSLFYKTISVYHVNSHRSVIEYAGFCFDFVLRLV